MRESQKGTLSTMRRSWRPSWIVSAGGQRWSAGRMVSVARAQRREELGELGVDVGEAQPGSKP